MSSIIKSLSIRNFKGFSDEVHIELRPITLLFGGNSAGKSSVLHALQYAREILERNNANADRTLQGGDAVDLGGFLNLVHGRDQKRRIEIEIGMLLGDVSIPEIVPDAFEDWQASDSEVSPIYETLQTIRRKVSGVSIRLIVGWNIYSDEPVVVGYEIGTNDVWCVKSEASSDGRDTHMRINRKNPIFMVNMPDSEALLAELDDWINPEDLQAEGADTDPEKLLPCAIVENSPQEQQTSILDEVFHAVKEAGMESPGEGLRSWLSGFNGAMPQLDKMLFIAAPGAKGAANVYVAREFTAFLSWLTIGPAMLLRDQLRKLRYVGPLRRIPPRGFQASLTKSEAAWSDGMAAWTTLLSGPKNLIDDCSDSMSSSDKLGTGYSIVRKPIQEFDLGGAQPRPIGRVRSRIELIDAAGLSHEPQDVGVGISQVLPVVVAALDGSASVVCIEQPELHIHPAVQVALGDLFIDGVLNHDLSFLIETHSEHLILRLLRRIREASEEVDLTVEPKVNPKLVGVYCLMKEDGRVTVIETPINCEGDFDKPWPNGFFDERGTELF